MKDMIGVSIGSQCLSEYFIDRQQNFVDISIDSDERIKFVVQVLIYLIDILAVLNKAIVKLIRVSL